MAAVALPIALVLGALADLVAGAGEWLRGRGGRRMRWWGRPVALWEDLRRAFTRREGITQVEAGGALASLFGSGLAAAAALGVLSGSAVLVYLALVVAAAGAHVAASTPGARAADARLARGRLVAALAEPAFLAALTAGFLRWRTASLDAVLGDQAVLGPGIALEPVTSAVGLGVAAAVLGIAGALRHVPIAEARRGPGRPGSSAALLTVCRWSLTGAVGLVAASLVVGGEPLGSGLAALRFFGAAAGVAVVAGAADGLLAGLPRVMAGPAALISATAAVVLVVLPR